MPRSEIDLVHEGHHLGVDLVPVDGSPDQTTYRFKYSDTYSGDMPKEDFSVIL